MGKLLPLLQALADPNRLRLATVLRQEALCVCELSAILELPQSTVSTYLRAFKKAGLVDAERCDKWIYYRLRPEVRETLDSLRDRFPADPAEDRQCQLDDARIASQLEERATSCCIGPDTPVRRGARPQSPPKKLVGC